MLDGLGAIDDKVGVVSQHIHRVASHLGVLLNLRKVANAWRCPHHGRHPTHGRWHTLTDHHVLAPWHNQIRERLLFRLSGSESVLSDHSHVTYPPELLIRWIDRKIFLHNALILAHIRSIKWNHTWVTLVPLYLISDIPRIDHVQIALMRLVLLVIISWA